MGHKSTAMTERYAHATDEGKRRAVEAIQSVSRIYFTNFSQWQMAGRTEADKSLKELMAPQGFEPRTKGL